MKRLLEMAEKSFRERIEEEQRRMAGVIRNRRVTKPIADIMEEYYSYTIKKVYGVDMLVQQEEITNWKEEMKE